MGIAKWTHKQSLCSHSLPSIGTHYYLVVNVEELINPKRGRNRESCRILSIPRSFQHGSHTNLNFTHSQVLKITFCAWFLFSLVCSGAVLWISLVVSRLATSMYPIWFKSIDQTSNNLTGLSYTCYRFCSFVCFLCKYWVETLFLMWGRRLKSH